MPYNFLSRKFLQKISHNSMWNLVTYLWWNFFAYYSWIWREWKSSISEESVTSINKLLFSLFLAQLLYVLTLKLRLQLLCWFLMNWKIPHRAHLHTKRNMGLGTNYLKMKTKHTTCGSCCAFRFRRWVWIGGTTQQILSLLSSFL